MRLGIEADLLKETWRKFGLDNASILAAAIAYSTVFALAPLLIVAIAVAGTVLGIANGGHGHHVAENQLVGMLGQAVGPGVAASVRTMVDTSFRSHQGSVVAQVVGWVMFIVGASGLFLTLQSALNTVWGVSNEQLAKRGLILTIRNRAVSAAMLVAVGFLMLVTTGLNFAISFLWSHLRAGLAIPGGAASADVVNWVVDAIVASAMFALLFKVLPDTDVAWKDVRVGAIASAILFVIGQALLGVYLGRAGVANGYGAAGSLVVLLVWVYYSAMLLLLGAEFTAVYAARHGSRAGKTATVKGEVPPGATATAAPRSR